MYGAPSSELLDRMFMSRNQVSAADNKSHFQLNPILAREEAGPSVSTYDFIMSPMLIHHPE